MKLIFSLICILLISVSCGKDSSTTKGSKASPRTAQVTVRSKVVFDSTDPTIFQVIDHDFKRYDDGNLWCQIATEPGVIFKIQGNLMLKLDNKGQIQSKSPLTLIEDQSIDGKPLGRYKFDGETNAEDFHAHVNMNLYADSVEFVMTCSLK